MKIIIYCGQKMKRTHIGNFVFYYWIEPESAPCEGAVLTVIRYKQMFFKNYSNLARIVFIYTTNFTRMFLKVLESSFHRKITCWLAR